MPSKDSIPPFASNIPAHLISALSEKERWLYENVSVLGQKTEFLMEKQEEHGKELGKQNVELAEIKKKLEYTNGKIGAAITDINNLQREGAERAALIEDVKGIVETKKTAKNLLTSKIFYIGAAIFTVGIITIAKSQALQEWLLAIFG